MDMGIIVQYICLWQFIAGLGFASIVFLFIIRSYYRQLNNTSHKLEIAQRRGDLLDSRLKKVVDLAGDGIVIINEKGKVASVNPAVERLLGLDRAQLVGADWAEVLSGMGWAMAMESMAASRLDGHIQQITRRDGTQLNVVVNYSTLIELSHTKVGAVCILREAMFETGPEKERRRMEDAYKTLAFDLSKFTGDELFQNLARHLSRSFGEAVALIGRIKPGEPETVEAFAVYENGVYVEPFSYPLAGSPCEQVLTKGACVYPEGVSRLFPKDTLLADIGIESYMGAPLLSSSGEPLGIMAILSREPLAEQDLAEAAMQVFSGRMATELERLEMEKALSESEFRLRSFFDQVNIGMGLTDLDFKFIKVNEGLARMFGYSREELIGKTPLDLTHPNDVAPNKEKQRQVVSGEVDFYSMEKRYVRKDGSVFWGIVGATVVSDPEGRPLYYVGQVQDITETKKTEAALKESEERYRRLVEYSPIPIFVQSNLKIIYINPAAVAALGGSSPEDFIGKNSLDLVDDEFRQFAQSRIENISDKQEATSPVDMKLRRLDGGLIDTQIMGSPVELGGQRAVQTVFLDITERKKMEKDLVESRMEWAYAMDFFEDAIYLLDMDLNVTHANSAFYMMTGLSPDKVIGRNIQKILHHAPEVDCPVCDAQNEKREAMITLEPDHPANPTGRPIEVMVKMVRDETRRPAAILMGIHDLTRQRSYESALEESEGRYRQLSENSPIPVVVHSKFKIEYINPAAVAALAGKSAEEFIGKDPIDYLDAAEKQRARKRVSLVYEKRETAALTEFQFKRKDGKSITVESMSSPVEFGGKPAAQTVFQDITERKMAEAELRTQAAIMENIAEGVQMIRMSDDVIVHTNPKFEQMFGYDHGEMIGKHVSIQNMPTEHTPLEIATHISRILKNKGEWSGEIFNVKKDGTPFWTYTTVTRYQDAKYGEVMLAVKRDVTETKLAREAMQESEERFRMLFENSPDAMLLAEADTGILLQANRAAEKLFKRQRKEFAGMHQSRLHLPEEGALARDRFKSRGEDVDPTIPVENNIMLADGTTAPVEVTGQRYMINGKKVILGVFRDLRERKKAEEALRDSEERYRALVESSDDCICLLDVNGYFLFMNQRGLELNGYGSIVEVKGKTCMDLLGAEFRPLMEGSLKKAARGEVSHVRYMTQSKGDSERWWESILNPISGPEGEVTAVLRISREITEQIRAEEELCQNQEILEAISQAQTRFILGEKAELMFEKLLHRIISLSRSEFGFIGEAHYDEAGNPFIKTHAISIMSGDKKAKKFMQNGFEPGMEFRKLDSLYGAVLTTGEYVISEDPAKDPRSSGLPHGHPALKSFMGVPLKRGGDLVGIIGLANRPGGYSDSMREFLEPFITTCASMLEASRADSRRLAAEKAVRDSEALFERLFSTTHMKLALLDKEMNFIKVNKAYAEADGKDVDFFPGKNHFRLYPNEENERIFEEVARTGEAYICYAKPFIYEANPERGVSYWDVSVQPLKEDDGRVFGLLLSLLDVTERKQAEEQARVRQLQLIHADKMKSLGILVAGVAHEINNPNSFIAVNAPLLKKIWEQGALLIRKSLEDNEGLMLGGMPMGQALEAAPKLLNGISEGSKRIQIIVEKLKNFARVEPGAKKRPVDMNNVVESSALLLASLIKRHTRNFVTSLGQGLPTVLGSQIEMEQVMINLISNALQSLEDMDKKVEVETGYDQKTGTVRVRVLDQGCGIAEENLGKITDPFYTTKREEGGTGLGLSVSFGIVREHGGIMRFDSKPGSGTTVTLEFPASNGESK